MIIQISPRWNSLTLAYLPNPVIKRLVWTHYTTPCKLQIRISRRLQHYSRVANWKVDETEANENSNEVTENWANYLHLFSL